MIDPADVPVRHVQWQPSYRLIASRFPTIGLFDTIAEPDELEAVFAFEMQTNERLLDEVGDIRRVPVPERVMGPGSMPIMASFTHLNPLGSRFSDGSYGMYYCADSREAAIAEVSHHQSLFLQRTREDAIDVDLRLITATLDADLHDLRGLRAAAQELYDPDSYQASQPFGARLRLQQSWGIVYDSVRFEGGQCSGVFRPRALKDAVAAGHVALHWDGQRITHWYEKGRPLRIQ